jgi:hypothetical protein
MTFATVVAVAIPSGIFRRGIRAHQHNLTGVTKPSEKSPRG